MTARQLINNLEALMELYTMENSPEKAVTSAQRQVEVLEELIARNQADEGTHITHDRTRTQHAPHSPILRVRGVWLYSGTGGAPGRLGARPACRGGQGGGGIQGAGALDGNPAEAQTVT